MSILPSVLSAATQEADLTEIQEAALAKENDSRIWQMLLFVGLRWARAKRSTVKLKLFRIEEEQETDDAEHNDRVVKIRKFFKVSSSYW